MLKFFLLSFFVVFLSVNYLKCVKMEKGWEMRNEETDHWKFIVSVQEQFISSNHLCVGIILTHYSILTAASCYNNLHTHPLTIISTETCKEVRGSFISIMAGVDDLFETSAAQSRKAYTITLHSNYKNNEDKNNIAIIEINEPMHFLRNVDKVVLNTKNPTATETGIVVGWIGWNDLSGPIEEQQDFLLNKANVRVLGDKDCRRFYDEYDNNTQFCISEINSLKAPCRGELGIPFLQKKNFETVLTGLASVWPKTCNAPALFTSINAHYNFIAKNVNLQIVNYTTESDLDVDYYPNE